MKILFLGEIAEGQTSLMRMRALQRLGHTVRGYNTVLPWQEAGWITRQLQRRLESGSVVDEINHQVVSAAKQFKPDLVWAEKQENLSRETLQSLRRESARLVHFTPDPYFSLSWKRSRTMDQALQEFDCLLYCKNYEERDYRMLGRPMIYMPLGYCDEFHRPVYDVRWNSDVCFLGGWDPYREHYLSGLSADDAVDLKIWGGYWDFLRDGKWSLRRWWILKQLAGEDAFSIHADPDLAGSLQGNEVYGEDYAKALSNSRIGLGFVRRVCPDLHTTRTFEIPACGTMMLADRTEEHQAFFEEGKEAEYFDSPEEMEDKVKFYLSDDTARTRIAEAGLQRCRDSGYSYLDRLRVALGELEALLDC